MVVTVYRIFFLSTKTGKNTKIKPEQRARQARYSTSNMKKWRVGNCDGVMLLIHSKKENENHILSIP